MCDRHDKKPLDHFCLEHEKIVCAQCATEEHSQTPCESMPVVEATRHIVPKLDIGMSELRKLKTVSQSILDGKRQDDTIRTVDEAEALLDDYVDELKKKLKKAKGSIRPFSELSREERWKLKSVATKKLPNGPPVRETVDIDNAKDLVTRLQEVRKQTSAAKEILNSLPNYVEVSVNQDFINSLKFEGNPIVIKRKGEVEDSGDEFDDSALEQAHQESVTLIEKSSFVLDQCTDIVIMDEYIIASVGNSVQKRDRKKISFRQAITIHGAANLCVIGETTEVSLLQKWGHIYILETVPDLKILFRLAIDKYYADISYLESVIGATGCPEFSPVFVVCYSNYDGGFRSDFVDLIKAKPTKYPRRPPTLNVEQKTIAESIYGKNKSRFRGIRSVSVFQHKDIIVGASNGVTCISKSGNLIWTIDLFQQITHVMAYRTIIFAAVKDEKKIFTIGKLGHVISDIGTDLCPEKMCAREDTLMVKHVGQNKWLIYKKIYESLE